MKKIRCAGPCGRQEDFESLDKLPVGWRWVIFHDFNGPVSGAPQIKGQPFIVGPAVRREARCAGCADFVPEKEWGHLVYGAEDGMQSIAEED